MGKLVKSMSIYSICHFIVDFVSCLFVLGVAPAFCFNKNGDFLQDMYIAEVIMYNFFAFAFQVPMGYFMDKYKIYKYVGIIGFCLIGICYVLGFGNPILLSSIVGIGNGLFHLEGGVNTFDNSKGKAFLNGLFVAPGTWGIFLGTFFYNQLADTYLPLVLIVLAIILLAFVQKDNIDFIDEEQEKVSRNGNLFKAHDVLSIAILIGISIVVRSIGGGAIKYAWKPADVFWIGFLYSSCVLLGKMFGGLIGDKFGLKKVATISLIASAFCLGFAQNIPALGIIGILLFNMTMPITLIMASIILPNSKGLAFGLTTLALFVGAVPSLIGLWTSETFNVLLVMIGIFVSAIIFYIGAILYDRLEEKKW